MPIRDPNENFNRQILTLNQAVLDPAATVVQTAVPGQLLNRLRDFDSNLKEPRVFGNNILQGRFAAAGVTLGRFVVNSTIGVGGLFDVASVHGLPRQSGDFGQTLFVWGVPDGYYVNSPYFGPSTQRDSVGGAVDTVLDPVGWTVGTVVGWPASVVTTALGASVHLGDWQRAQNSSIDFYSFLRSSYYQTRRAQLREGLGLSPATESPATGNVAPVTGHAPVGAAAAPSSFDIPAPQ
jgi:phospholipid-binding lipoprotein MlaA